VQSNALEQTTVFLELQFFTARSAQEYVIRVVRLLANKEGRFLFLFAFSHFLRIYLQQNCGFGHFGTRIMGIAWILASSIGLFKRSGIGNQANYPYIQNGFPTRNLPKYLT